MNFNESVPPIPSFFESGSKPSTIDKFQEEDRHVYVIWDDNRENQRFIGWVYVSVPGLFKIRGNARALKY